MSTKLLYVLDKNKNPVRAESIIAWSRFMEEREGNYRVGLTELHNGIRISTVFLGLVYGYVNGKPVLFETMIFGGEMDGYQERYTTWDDAMVGHWVAIALAKRA